MIQDQIGWQKNEQALAPASRVATVSTSAIETKGWRDQLFTIHAGTFTGAASMTPKLQQTDDDPTGSPAWVDVGAAGTAITSANDVDDLLVRVDLRDKKAWTRLTFTYAGNGTTDTAVFGVSSQLRDPTKSAAADNTMHFSR